jgi:hypothetical protein
MTKTIVFDPVNVKAQIIQGYPKPAIKFIPNWYKEVPPFSNGDKKLRFPIDSGMPNSTLKKCVPFLDALTSGYMAYLEEDIHVEQVNGEPFIRWRSSDEIISWHTLDQFPGLTIPKDYHYMVAKWANYWTINVPNDYSVLFSHPSNRIDLPFFTFSGLVSCDIYNSSVQFPFILKKGFEGIIEEGTPVCQLNIIKNEKWKTEVREYNEERVIKNNKQFFKTFVGSYKKNFWKKHSYA